MFLKAASSQKFPGSLVLSYGKHHSGVAILLTNKNREVPGVVMDERRPRMQTNQNPKHPNHINTSETNSSVQLSPSFIRMGAQMPTDEWTDEKNGVCAERGRMHP